MLKKIACGGDGSAGQMFQPPAKTEKPETREVLKSSPKQRAFKNRNAAFVGKRSNAPNTAPAKNRRIPE
jgi:hypothetical protein